jgi:hypothetical protein
MRSDFHIRKQIVTTIISILLSCNIIFCQINSEEYYVWAKSGLALRNSPGSLSKKIDIIPYGYKIKVDEQNINWENLQVISAYFIDEKHYPGFSLEGSWVNVIYNGNSGYIFTGFLSKLPPMKLTTYKSGYYAVETMNEWADREFGILKAIKLHGDTLSEYVKDKIIYNNGLMVIKETDSGKFWEQIIIPEANLKDGFLIFNLINNFLNGYENDQKTKNHIHKPYIEEKENIIIFYPGSQSETIIHEIGNILIISTSGGC